MFGKAYYCIIIKTHIAHTVAMCVFMLVYDEDVFGLMYNKAVVCIYDEK